MLEERLAALQRRGLELPPPVVVAESWLSDSQLMRHVRRQQEGLLLVEGKSASVLTLPDGRRVRQDLLEPSAWAWRDHPWEPRVRSARLRAQSPTYGAVTVVIVDDPGQDRFYLLCLATTMSAPQLIRRWRQRHWIACVLRTLQHLLATEACQVHNEDAYSGHLVLRLMASVVLCYTSCVICKGRLTMEEIVFSLKHSWRFVNSAASELQGLSCDIEQKTA